MYTYLLILSDRMPRVELILLPSRISVAKSQALSKLATSVRWLYDRSKCRNERGGSKLLKL